MKSQFVDANITTRLLDSASQSDFQRQCIFTVDVWM